jgi:hypothetical protein
LKVVIALYSFWFRLEQEETIALMKSEAEKEAARLEATTKVEIERKLADANLTAEKNLAKASRILSNAEGVVAPYLSKKNAHISSMKQMNVYGTLARDRNLILCDTDDDDANLAVVANSILAGATSARGGGNHHASRSAVLARLSIMHRGLNGLHLNNERTNARQNFS